MPNTAHQTKRVLPALCLAAALCLGCAASARAEGHVIATNKGPDEMAVVGKLQEGLSLKKCKDDCRKNSDSPAAEECCRLKCDYDRCVKTHGISLPDRKLQDADPANRIEAEPVCRPEKLDWQRCVREKLYCREFARQALGDTQTSRQYQCGQSGAIWPQDEKDYRDRCRQDRRSRREMEAEAKERRKLLADCIAEHELCDRYARGGVAQQKLNLQKRCGYQGPGWSADYQPVYRQCRQGKFSQQKVKGIIAARNRLLVECQAKGQEDRRQLEMRCRAFAGWAAKRQEQNLKMRCGQKGELWSSDKEALYRLCVNNRMSAQTLQKKWQAHKKAMDDCVRRLQSFAGYWSRTGKQITLGYTVNVDDALVISVKDGKASILIQPAGQQCQGTEGGGVLRWRCENSIGVEEGTYRLEKDGFSFKGESSGYFRVGGKIKATYQGARQ